VDTEQYDTTAQYAGEVRPCALCGCTETIFDGDLCDACDHVMHGVLDVVGRYSAGGDDEACITVARVVAYFQKNPQLRP
jgi:hypothetical protein